MKTTIVYVRQKKRKASKLNYKENKGIWTFVASWMEHFPNIVDSNFGIKFSFIDGCNSNRINTIQSHWKSPGHLKKLTAQNVRDVA